MSVLLSIKRCLGLSPSEEQSPVYIIEYRKKYLQPKDSEGQRLAGDLWEARYAVQNYSSMKKVVAAAGMAIFCLGLLFREKVVENPIYLWAFAASIPITVFGCLDRAEKVGEYRRVENDLRQQFKCRDEKSSAWSHFQPIEKETLQDFLRSRVLRFLQGCECVARMLFKGVEQGSSCSLCSREVKVLS